MNFNSKPFWCSKHFKIIMDWGIKFSYTSLFKFLFIAVIVIGAGPLFNFIIKTSVGIETVGDANAWIGYFGNLLGTSAAIIALSFTLRQNSKNHEELKKLQIETALHAKKQERLRAVIADLKDIYSNTHPENLANEVAAIIIGRSNTSLITISTVKKLKYTQGVVEFTANINKDIVTLSDFSTHFTSYIDKVINEISNIEVEVAKNINGNIYPRLFSISDLEEFKTYKDALFESIRNAQNLLDQNLAEQSSPTKS